MKVNITARNTGIKDSFRARAEKKLAKFDKFFGGNAQAQVTVIHSGDHETVEVTIKSEGLFFRAERTADEREDALEAVIDSLFRQIVKNKSKLEKRMKSASFTPEFVGGVQGRQDQTLPGKTDGSGRSDSADEYAGSHILCFPQCGKRTDQRCV